MVGDFRGVAGKGVAIKSKDCRFDSPLAQHINFSSYKNHNERVPAVKDRKRSELLKRDSLDTTNHLKNVLHSMVFQCHHILNNYLPNCISDEIIL